MEFKKTQTIYLQIADIICEHILSDNWKPDAKVPSVREFAATLQVNPNTVMRTYTHLQDKDIIYNKRGIGFFVEAKAKTVIKNLEKNQFLKEELPAVFKKMVLLDIDLSQVESIYQEAKTQHSNQEN
jgi:DNA-binding transcriptional regulator YhcF (GntR family)